MSVVGFRAAVLRAVGRPLVVGTVTLGVVKPREVLVRLHASGLCHTDLEVILNEEVRAWALSRAS